MENILCDGAARGILFRGLPEMNISDIHVNGATIVANEGMEIVEASNISLKNVSLHCEKATSLIHVENSSGISFENFSSNPLPKTLFSIDGDRTKNIRLIHSPQLDKNRSNQFGYGAKEGSLTIEK